MLNGIASGFASLMEGLVGIMESCAGGRDDYNRILKQKSCKPMTDAEALNADARALADDMEAMTGYRPTGGSASYWKPRTQQHYWPNARSLSPNRGQMDTRHDG
jgi:hypothetical protein